MSNQQEWNAFGSGEMAEDACPTCGYKYCRCDELIFTGRYDKEPELQKMLRELYQLRQSCEAIAHAKGKLDYNPSTNIMVCGHCGTVMDLNDFVSPELRVSRRVA